MASTPHTALVFMKAGFHANETLPTILERKANEQATAGAIFWGYGGTLCHPTRQIRPFAERCTTLGLSVSVVMSTTPSKFNAEPKIATAFSRDGVLWQPLPPGVTVKASRYALVMRDLRPCRTELDLNSYVVAIGPNEGKSFGKYIRGRVDKGCAIYRPPLSPKKSILVAIIADLVSPYAVFVR